MFACFSSLACMAAPVKIAPFVADVTPPPGSIAPYGMNNKGGAAHHFTHVTDPLFAKGLVIVAEGQAPLLFVRRNAGAAPIELSRLTLGPAEIVHYPGEPFIEYQLAAQAMRPDRFVCFAGFGDYGPGYISTEIGHFQGGFEAERWCRTAPGAERVLLEATRQLLDGQDRAVERINTKQGDR